MIRAILLDFDGVIKESVEIKTEALAMLFQEYPERLEEILQYHRDNGGLSRVEKFRHIYRAILREELSEAKFRDLCTRFTELCVSRVIAASYVPGALEFLEKYHAQIPMFVISGTPQEEIDHIIAQLSLARYFIGMMGSPTQKIAWIEKILTTHSWRPDETLFIGDAWTDWDAAVRTGLHFIGRIKSGGEDLFRGVSPLWKVADFTQVESILAKLQALPSCQPWW